MKKSNVHGEGQKSAAYRSKDEPITYIAIVKLDGSEPEDTVVGEDGREYIKTDQVHFDLEAIPRPKVDAMCEAILDGLKRILEQPGGRDMLDAKTAVRKARQAAQAKHKMHENTMDK